MLQAVRERDKSFDGVFYIAVRTTRIFCRPVCPARAAKPENVVFYASPEEATAAGYRACKRCKPMDRVQEPPEWVRSAMAMVEQRPEERVSEKSLAENGISPERLRRWFRQNYGTTFQSYQRGLRLGQAHRQISAGTSVIECAKLNGWDSTSGFREAFQREFGTSPSHAGGAVFCVQRIETPLGPMVAVADDSRLYLLEFADRRMMPTQMKALQSRYGCSLAPGEPTVLRALRGELREYFAGSLRSFSVRVDHKGTEFQESVWNRLKAIHYGATLSYGDLAGQLGRPDAQRAVGKANGDNRIAIIVPCHRVIRSDGSLCGYGGGLWRKQRLLELERGQLKLL